MSALWDRKGCMLLSKGTVTAMYTTRYIQGHIHVYDAMGNFLFSADNIREVREELEAYEESAA